MWGLPTNTFRGVLEAYSTPDAALCDDSAAIWKGSQNNGMRGRGKGYTVCIPSHSAFHMQLSMKWPIAEVRCSVWNKIISKHTEAWRVSWWHWQYGRFIERKLKQLRSIRGLCNVKGEHESFMFIFLAIESGPILSAVLFRYISIKHLYILPTICPSCSQAVAGTDQLYSDNCLHAHSNSSSDSNFIAHHTPFI